MAEILGDENLEYKIGNFSLVPSDGGRFEFTVNDQLLFSKKQLGRHAEPGEVISILRKHMTESA
jgi:selenoprotein W-related protein